MERKIPLLYKSFLVLQLNIVKLLGMFKGADFVNTD